MDLNNTETAANYSTEVRSVLSCPHAPTFMWELNDATVVWIVVAITSTASPTAVLLNALVILAVKQGKAAHRVSNHLLSSMAVGDLLVGAVCMPLTVVVNSFIARQVLPEPVCTLDVVSLNVTYITSCCSLFHVTVIAWERYVAIQKWEDYKIIVTRSRVNKLAIIVWVSAVFIMLPEVIITAVLDKDDAELAMEKWFVVNAVCAVCFLAVIAYFYVMVYLGIRKRNLSDISQVVAPMTAKLENKVTKTMGLVTAALFFTFVPVLAVRMLGGVFPVLWKPSAFSLSMLLVQLNSIMNPLIYCYRERRFRNAVLELLGIRKPQANQPTEVAAPRFVRRKEGFGFLEGVVELQNVEISARLTRSAPCDQDLVLESAQLATLKRSSSATSLAKGINSCEGQQQPSTTVMTTAMIYAESKEQNEASTTNQVSPKGAKSGNKKRNDAFGPCEDTEAQRNEMES